MKALLRWQWILLLAVILFALSACGASPSEPPPTAPAASTVTASPIKPATSASSARAATPTPTATATTTPTPKATATPVPPAPTATSTRAPTATPFPIVKQQPVKDARAQSPEAAGRFATASTFIEQGKFAQAITELNAAIRLDADFGYAYYYRGFANAQLRNCASALADYDRAAQLRPDIADIYRARGACYAMRGETARALTDLNELIARQPDADGYNARGTVYLARGEHDRAIADFGKSIALAPRGADGYILRAIARWLKGDDAAQATYDLQRGTDLDRMRAPDAFSALSGAIAQSADSPYPRMARRSVTVFVSANYATMLADIADFSRAFAYADLALALDGDDPYAALARGYVMLQRASLTRTAEDRELADIELDAAVLAASELIGTYPDNWYGYFVRALAHKYKGEMTDARSDLRMAMERCGDYNTHAYLTYLLNTLSGPSV